MLRLALPICVLQTETVKAMIEVGSADLGPSIPFEQFRLALLTCDLPSLSRDLVRLALLTCKLQSLFMWCLQAANKRASRGHREG